MQNSFADVGTFSSSPYMYDSSDISLHVSSFESNNVVDEIDFSKKILDDVTDIKPLPGYPMAYYSSIEYPEYVPVGEEFDVTVKWTFTEYDEEGNVEHESIPYKIDGTSIHDQTTLSIKIPQNIEMITDVSDWDVSTALYHDTSFNFNNTFTTYSKTISFDYADAMHEQVYKFKATSEFVPPFDHIQFDGLGFSKTMHHQDGVIQSSSALAATTSAQSFVSVERMGIADPQYPEMLQSDVNWEKAYDVAPKGINTPDEPDNSQSQAIRDFYINVLNRNPTNDELLATGVSQEWIDGFFEKYPELQVSEVDVVLDFLLPSIFAQTPEDFIFVGGKIQYDIDGVITDGQYVEVCLRELDSSGNPKFFTQNGEELCDIADIDGNWNIIVENIDPDTGAPGIDLTAFYFLDNEAADIKPTASSPSTFYCSPIQIFDINQGLAIFGTDITPSNEFQNNFGYLIYKYVNDAHEFFKNNPATLTTFGEVNVLWKYNTPVIGGAFYQYANESITLTGTMDGNFIDFIHNSPDTIVHEYGHHIIWKTQESLGGNSVLPPCNDRHFVDQPNTEACAHDEGFPNFFAVLVKDDPVFDIVTTPDTFNFETRQIQLFDSGNVDFQDGKLVEGNFASIMWDIYDNTNESGDNISNGLNLIWSTFNDPIENDERNYNANTLAEFVNDWSDSGNVGLNQILPLNTVNDLLTNDSDGDGIPDDIDQCPTQPGTVANNGCPVSLSSFEEEFQNTDNWNISSGGGFFTTTSGFPPPDVDKWFLWMQTCNNMCTIEMIDSLDMGSIPNAELEMQMRIFSTFDTGDYVELQVSTDNGNNWSVEREWTGAAGDDTNVWTSYTVDLSSYPSSQFKIRFVIASDGNNENVLFDRVNITGTVPDVTAPVITITSPTNGEISSTGDMTVSGTVVEDESTLTSLSIQLDSNPVIPLPLSNSWSHTLTGLSDGSHTASVTATNGAELTASDSVAFTVNTSTAPDAPTGLVSNAVSPTQVDLVWFAPDNNGGSAITGYTIERNLNDAGFTVLVSDTASALTTYSDVSLDGGDTAQYRVSAINDAGTSGSSNISSSTTPIPNDSPIVTVTLPINGTTFDDDYTISFAGTAIDVQDGDISESLTWASDIDGIIGNGTSFGTSSLTSSIHNITASVIDSDNAVGSDSVLITIGNIMQNTTSSTNSGTIIIQTDAGVFSSVNSVAESALSTTNKPSGLSFPHGLLSWNVTGLDNGDAISLTITYPDDIPASSQYWKIIDDSWVNATEILDSDDGDNIITLTIADGGTFDADSLVNGIISDPGGIAVIPAVASDNIKPVAISGDNQNVQAGELVTLNGTASYDYNGDTLNYSWVQTDSTGYTVDLSSPTSATTTFTAPTLTTDTIIEFTLTVSDGSLSDSATIEISIIATDTSTVVDDTCATPQSGDWIITQSCTMSTSAVAPANILVQDNSVLTIPDGVTLDVDLQNYSIMVKDGSSIIIRDGGTVVDDNNDDTVVDDNNDDTVVDDTCATPQSGDWIITQSCTMSTSAVAPANILVQDNSVLTIPDGVTLDVDLQNYSIMVKDGSSIIIRDGGTVVDDNNDDTVVDDNNDDTVVDDTCATPQSGDWIITQSCTMSTSAVAPANILVQDNSVLTIPDGVTLDVDLQNYSIMVKDGSSIIIRDGGTVVDDNNDDTVVDDNNDDTVVDDTCATPQSGDWIITQSCTMSTSAVAPANILVQDNSVLTIPDGVTLDVDLQNYSIMVKDGSNIIIRDGGTVVDDNNDDTVVDDNNDDTVVDDTCATPQSGDWIITQSCTMSTSAVAPANILVQDNSVLTIPDGVTLDVDLQNYSIMVKDGSSIIIRDGGTVVDDNNDDTVVDDNNDDTVVDDTCATPQSGDWIITQSCTMSTSAVAPANILVQDNSVLTIPDGVTLDVDLQNYSIMVKDGSSIIIRDGGTVVDDNNDDTVVDDNNDDTVVDDTCATPQSGDWIITQSCTMSTSAVAPANILVQDNSVLTIPDGVTLDVDLQNYSIMVKDGSSIIIRDGGTVVDDNNDDTVVDDNNDDTVVDDTCATPQSGDWIITQSCTMSTSAVAPANILVQDNSVLTIPDGVTLDVDLQNYSIMVKDGSNIIIRDGGTIT